MQTNLTQENQLPQLIPNSIQFKHPRHRSVHGCYQYDKHQIKEDYSLQKQYRSQKPRKQSIKYPRIKKVKNSKGYRQNKQQKSPSNTSNRECGKQIENKSKLEKLYHKKWELKHRLERLNTELVSIRELHNDIDLIKIKTRKSIEKQRRINLSRKAREQENYKDEIFKQENSKEKNTRPKGRMNKKLIVKNRKDLVYSDQPHQLHHRCLQCCQFSLNKEDIALKNIKDLQHKQYSVESELPQPSLIENSQKSNNQVEQDQDQFI